MKIKISNPPDGMNPDQEFEDDAHFDAWCSEQINSGKIRKCSKNGNKITFIERGRELTEEDSSLKEDEKDKILGRIFTAKVV